MAWSSSTTNTVDDRLPFQTQGQLLDRGAHRVRLGKESLDQACQILCPNRLVQMHAAVAGMSRKLSVEISPVRIMAGIVC